VQPAGYQKPRKAVAIDIMTLASAAFGLLTGVVGLALTFFALLCWPGVWLEIGFGIWGLVVGIGLLNASAPGQAKSPTTVNVCLLISHLLCLDVIGLALSIICLCLEDEETAAWYRR
jgi:hypothetical protein